MSLQAVMKIAASGMSAQSVRLNTTASNFANANVASRTEAETYRALTPIFSTALVDEVSQYSAMSNSAMGVKVTSIEQNNAEPIRRYDPTNALADETGHVYMPNINQFDEMTNMLSASNDYRLNLEVFMTSKSMMQRALQLLEGR